MVSSATPSPRKQERQHLRFPVSWWGNVQTASGPLPLRVIDVSQGGIGVTCDNPLPSAGVFSITLRVPVSHGSSQFNSVNAQVRVIYQLFSAGRNRAGLEFVQIAPAEAELLVSCAQKRV
ncbi:MAG TPA: PilZ domain-containing protein [Albitalea sp.]|nr:PilZ domain-containing protein [Albitalea sp.]